MNTSTSPEKFVKEYGPALEEYLQTQFREQGHVLDMLASAAEFFSVSYYSVGASLEILKYTEPATEK